MRHTAALCLASLSVLGCTASHHPTGTLVIDDAVFATASSSGWTHVSGEVALTFQDGEIDVNGRMFPLEEVVSCEPTPCTMVTSSEFFALRGDDVVIDGVTRGVVQDANDLGRASALVALHLYEPPGGVWATTDVFGERVVVGAMPDGRLVRGEPCRWPSDCRSLEELGHWTDAALVVGSASHALSEVVRVVDGMVETRPGPGAPPTFRLPATDDSRRSEWNDVRRIRLEFGRSGDFSTQSDIARAALGALTLHLQSRSAATPPPPPPPPAAP